MALTKANALGDEKSSVIREETGDEMQTAIATLTRAL